MDGIIRKKSNDAPGSRSGNGRMSASSSRCETCGTMSPIISKKMEEKGLTPDDIKSLDDLHKLPFVTKDDLRKAYPYGLVARPLKECVRIQSTSGHHRKAGGGILYPARY